MLDPYTQRLFHIESSGNPNAVTGSNRGLGQFGPSEWAQYGGGGDWHDPNAQVAALGRERAANASKLTATLGRAPTPGEEYLMHQQGVAGGPALLSADPSTPAWQAIRKYYGSDHVAQSAITGNIPRGSPLYGRDPNSITAGDFTNYWKQKFESGDSGANAASYSAAGAASPIKTAMNQQGGQNVADDSGILGAGQGMLSSGGLANGMQSMGAGLLAIDNPSGGASMMNALNTRLKDAKPQLVEMGTNPMTGKKTYALYDPQSQSFKPFGGGAAVSGSGNQWSRGAAPSAGAGVPTTAGTGVPTTAGTPSASMGGTPTLDDFDPGKFSQNLNAVQTGKMSADDFKKTLPPEISTYSQALIDGQEDPKDLGPRAGMLRPYALLAAHGIDSGFNANQIPARQAWVKGMQDTSRSSIGGQFASFNQLISHLYDRKQASDEAGQHEVAGGQYTPINKVQHFAAENLGDSPLKSSLARGETASTGAADEIVSLLTNGKGSLEDRKQYQGMLSMDRSHSQRDDSAGQAIGLVKGHMEELASNYNRAYGLSGDKAKNWRDFMSPEAQKKLDYLSGGGGAAPGGLAVKNMPNTQSPSGQSGQSSSGQSWTDPKTGTSYRVINGKLYHQ